MIYQHAAAPEKLHSKYNTLNYLSIHTDFHSLYDSANEQRVQTAARTARASKGARLGPRKLWGDINVFCARAPRVEARVRSLTCLYLHQPTSLQPAKLARALASSLTSLQEATG